MNPVKIIIIILCVLFKLQGQNDPVVDSLKKILTVSKDTARLAALGSLIDVLPNEQDWWKFNEELGSLAKSIFNKTTDPKIMIFSAKYSADYFNNVAYHHQLRGENKYAILNYERSLQIKKIIGDKHGTTVTLVNIGTIYGEEGNYSLALDYLYESLKISEEIKYAEGCMTALNNIGSAYLEQKQFNKADEYFQKCLVIATKENNLLNLAGIYSNLGVLYAGLNKRDISIEYYQKCLSILKPFQNYYGLATIYNNIATANVENRNYPAAMIAIDSSIKYSEMVHLTTLLATNYHNKAQIFFETGKHKEAMKMSLLEEKLAKESQSSRVLNSAALLAYRLNKLNGNYKKALEYHETYLSTKDSIESEKNKKASISKQFKYEYEKKEDKAKMDQARKDVIVAEEKRIQGIITLSISIGLFLMCLLAGLIFRSLYQNKKKNKIITEQKMEVEKQKEIVEEHQKEILDSIHYAKRIQQAQLPTQKYIEKSLKSLKK